MISGKTSQFSLYNSLHVTLRLWRTDAASSVSGAYNCRRHLQTTAVNYGAKLIDLSGIYPPIVTPFDAAENIDWEALEKNIKLWNNIPFRGYVVQGSNGEYAYMEKDERLKLVEKVKESMPDNALLIAGSGCESTRSTVEMTNRMAERGADAALVVTPCFYKSGMSDAAMLSYYTRVADESDIPIILYNVPPNTGIDLSSEVGDDEIKFQFFIFFSQNVCLNCQYYFSLNNVYFLLDTLFEEY